MESVDWLYGDHRKFEVPRQRPIKEIVSKLLPAKLQMYALRKGWISSFTASAPRGPLWQTQGQPGTLELILKYRLSHAFVDAHGPEDWKLQQALDQRAANFSWVVTSPDYQYGRRQRNYARVISDNWGNTQSVFLSNPNFGQFPEKYPKLNITLLETSGTDVLTSRTWAVDNPAPKAVEAADKPSVIATSDGVTARLLHAIGGVADNPLSRITKAGEDSSKLWREHGTLVQRADKGEIGWSALQVELTKSGIPTSDWVLRSATVRDKSGVLLNTGASMREGNWLFLSGNINAAKDLVNIELEAEHNNNFEPGELNKITASIPPKAGVYETHTTFDFTSGRATLIEIRNQVDVVPKSSSFNMVNKTGIGLIFRMNYMANIDLRNINLIAEDRMTSGHQGMVSTMGDNKDKTAYYEITPEHKQFNNDPNSLDGYTTLTAEMWDRKRLKFNFWVHPETTTGPLAMPNSEYNIFTTQSY